MPVELLITEGKSSDIGVAKELVREDVCEFLLADKGYDSDKFRNYLSDRSIILVIPGRRNRIKPLA